MWFQSSASCAQTDARAGATRPAFVRGLRGRVSGLRAMYAAVDEPRPRVALVDPAGDSPVDSGRSAAVEASEPAAIAGEKSQSPPALALAPTPRPHGRASREVSESIAKRNNKDLTQMSVFVRKKLHKRVKIRLAELESVDLSDVVDKLLEQWLADQSA